MKDSSKDVFKQMDAIAGEMETLFYHLFSPKHPMHPAAQQHWSPMSDVFETAEQLVVRMELAGVKREQIGISLENDRLLIRGVRHEDRPEGVTVFHHMEINYGCFERALHLRPGVRQEDIGAHFEDGILTITIAKRRPAQGDPVEIEVE